jgi:hypothetical protein
MNLRTSLVAAVFCVSLAPEAGAADWPVQAERSGPRLTLPREIAATAVIRGAYVPEASAAVPGSTGTIGGAITWSFAPFARLGLFGRHELEGYFWANVALLAIGHEAGLRFSAARHLAFEAAYLSHRVSRVWIDDFETRPGGVSDMGGELGAWLPFAPHERIRLDLHVVSRIFEVYKDTQSVLGGGVRLSLLVARDSEVVVELTLLRAARSRPRSEVDVTTWNVIGEASLRSRLTRGLGLLIGARLSTSMLVGEQPMLELKRSMIEEPMGVAYAGMSFGI